MRAQGPGVRARPRVAAAPRPPSALARLEEGGERRLRVDDDVLAAGQVHDEVGPDAGAVRAWSPTPAS